MTETKKDASLPTYRELLLERSLYDVIPPSGDWAEYLNTLRFEHFQFDAHCIFCGSDSTFKSSHNPYRPANLGEALKTGPLSRSIACTRHGHPYSYYFRLAENGIQKVGQFPSIEDVAGAELKRYKPVLANEDFRELRRATGLFSHGIGIGSFVYLRRIFERMIVKHKVEAEQSGQSLPADFVTSRMDEKIAALSSVLPPSLVKNRAVYGILSKGIHELDEDTCRAYFPVVRAAIMQILEQDLEARLKKQAEADLEKEIARANSALSGKTDNKHS